MNFCAGFGRKRGECKNEALSTNKDGIKLCAECYNDELLADNAAAQATIQREADLERGLVTVWE